MAKDKGPRRPRAETPKGFRDYFGAEVTERKAMLDKIAEVYHRHGFDPLETSAVETVEALGKFLPDVDRPNEGVFAWQDEDKDWLALRYDLTAPLARVAAQYRNDLASPRIRRYLPRFRAAAVPDPDTGDWAAWAALLGEREHDAEAGPGGAMNVVTTTGFGTICSSLLALPAAGNDEDDGGDAEEIGPIWRFAAWTDAPGDYTTVSL